MERLRDLSHSAKIWNGIVFHKKGRWATYPADTELWHTPLTSLASEKRFGVFREILAVCYFGKEYENHMYVPVRYVEKLHARIKEITDADPKGLEKILLRFYTERDEVKNAVAALNPSDLSAISNTELAEIYRKNRALAHDIVAYDQFTWLAEDYWLPLMNAVLVEKHGLVKDSPEYVEALYALIKPREISTTLEEKKEVLKTALAIKRGKEKLPQAAKRLTNEFGWMPVLAFGEPWDARRYEQELSDTVSRDAQDLRKELDELSRYTELRDLDFNAAVKKYDIADMDAQVFVDFGFAIDTRNEAEYVASVCGFYMLPLYDEMAKRLSLTIPELRTLFENDIIACLKGDADAKSILADRTEYVSWLVEAENKSRINFSPEDSRRIFEYAESQNASRDSGGTARRGVIANRGKAKGVVRLLFSPNDNHKVEEGDILIAFSTMVDNLPAMKKAAAMVTESGGLTCHAAVVAREFGVPCIVGLSGAMSDFKDGDVVEVDADTGVVRILKKAGA